MAEASTSKSAEPPTLTSKQIKKKRAAEKKRTAALFSSSNADSADNFFAVDLGADQATIAKLQSDQYEASHQNSDHRESNEAVPLVKQEPDDSQGLGSNSKHQHSEPESGQADSNSDNSIDDLFANLAEAPGRRHTDQSRQDGEGSSDETDEEERSMRIQLEADQDAQTQSRYYAPDAKDKTKKCTRCGDYGHIMSKCPHDACTVCGALDDHIARNCPHSMTCRRCGAKGHRADECTNRGQQREYECSLCGSVSHTTPACPKLWRTYERLPSELRPRKRQIVYACYNCGQTGVDDGHFGTECPYPRGHPLQKYEPSAFTDGTGRAKQSLQWPSAAYRNGFGGNRPPPPSGPMRRPNIVNGQRQRGPAAFGGPPQRDSDYDDLLSNVNARKRSHSRPPAPPPPRSGERGHYERKAPRVETGLLARLGQQVNRDAPPSTRPSDPRLQLPQFRANNRAPSERGDPRSRAPSRPPPPAPEFEMDHQFDAGAYDDEPPSPPRRSGPSSYNRPPPPPASAQSRPPAIDPWDDASDRRTHAQKIADGDLPAPSMGRQMGRLPKNRKQNHIRDYDHRSHGGVAIRGLAAASQNSGSGSNSRGRYDDWDEGSGAPSRPPTSGGHWRGRGRGRGRGGPPPPRPSRSYV